MAETLASIRIPERKTNFTFELTIHPNNKVRFRCSAVDVRDAFNQADEWCNKHYPDKPVTFEVFRYPQPPGGYDF